MPRYTAENTQGWIRTEGVEYYVSARDRGKGVLVLTGHLGAWELSSFYHSLMGYPMGMVIRHLDNPWLDDFVNGIRCLHGNRVLSKDDFARGLLTAMHPHGHQHDPAAGCLCELFFPPCLYRLGVGPRGP
jgi:KDO2-lipid IV(A) lauroyltransferase